MLPQSTVRHLGQAPARALGIGIGALGEVASKQRQREEEEPAGWGGVGDKQRTQHIQKPCVRREAGMVGEG